MRDHPGGAQSSMPPRVDFSRSPFLVIWETTRSCGLACRHCRASALLGRDPGELTTEEGQRVLDQIADMGTPICILSGGDPLNRPDLDELVAHGKSRGLRMGTIPAATSQLTQARVDRLKQVGLDQIAFSLDGPTAETHDAFRQVQGSFDKTLEGVGFARHAGLPLQINTCFGAWNFTSLDDMVALVSKLGVVFWEVFFLIPTGRGKNLGSLTPRQFEDAFDRLHRLNQEVPFVIKLTEAPHYRRFVIQREQATDQAPDEARARIQHILARPRGVGEGMGLSPQAVNAGKGFLFVDYLGNICPSGFLPIPAGNVRTHALAEVYRKDPLFLALRNASLLKGKCGSCDFSSICGGSRARAHAVTGDYLASDPYCEYQPVQKELMNV